MDVAAGTAGPKDGLDQFQEGDRLGAAEVRAKQVGVLANGAGQVAEDHAAGAPRRVEVVLGRRRRTQQRRLARQAGQRGATPLLLGGIGLVAFLWALKHRQYEDPEGDSQRILKTEWDDRPKP